MGRQTVHHSRSQKFITIRQRIGDILVFGRRGITVTGGSECTAYLTITSKGLFVVGTPIRLVYSDHRFSQQDIDQGQIGWAEQRFVDFLFLNIRSADVILKNVPYGTR